MNIRLVNLTEDLNLSRSISSTRGSSMPVKRNLRCHCMSLATADKDGMPTVRPFAKSFDSVDLFGIQMKEAKRRSINDRPVAEILFFGKNWNVKFEYVAMLRWSERRRFRTTSFRVLEKVDRCFDFTAKPTH